MRAQYTRPKPFALWPALDLSLEPCPEPEPNMHQIWFKACCIHIFKIHVQTCDMTTVQMANTFHKNGTVEDKSTGDCAQNLNTGCLRHTVYTFCTEGCFEISDGGDWHASSTPSALWFAWSVWSERGDWHVSSALWFAWSVWSEHTQCIDTQVSIQLLCKQKFEGKTQSATGPSDCKTQEQE